MDGSIASDVIHAIRGRFTAVQPFLEMLQDGLAGELSDTQRNCVEAAARNADRLFVTVTDLLELLRDDLGGLPLSCETVKAADIAARAAALADVDVASRMNVGSCADRLLRADPARAAVVLATLLRRLPPESRACLRAVDSCEAHPGRACLVLGTADCGGTGRCELILMAQDGVFADGALLLGRSLIERQGGRLLFEAQGGTACLALPAAVRHEGSEK